jgi:hypothetical protein
MIMKKQNVYAAGLWGAALALGFWFAAGCAHPAADAGSGVTVNAATPVISAQPLDADYTYGGTAEALTVTASADDGGTLTYQWYENTAPSTDRASPIIGATEASYAPPVSAAGTRYYFVTVTNTNDSATGVRAKTVCSAIAKVTVEPASAGGAETVTIGAGSVGGVSAGAKRINGLDRGKAYIVWIGGANSEIYITGATGAVGNTATEFTGIDAIIGLQNGTTYTIKQVVDFTAKADGADGTEPSTKITVSLLPKADIDLTGGNFGIGTGSAEISGFMNNGDGTYELALGGTWVNRQPVTVSGINPAAGYVFKADRVGSGRTVALNGLRNGTLAQFSKTADNKAELVLAGTDGPEWKALSKATVTDWFSFEPAAPGVRATATRGSGDKAALIVVFAGAEYTGSVSLKTDAAAIAAIQAETNIAGVLTISAGAPVEIALAGESSSGLYVNEETSADTAWDAGTGLAGILKAIRDKTADDSPTFLTDSYTVVVPAGAAESPAVDLSSEASGIGEKTRLTLKGADETSAIRLTGTGSLFTVTSGKTLTLDSITLEGVEANTAALVTVNAGGTLTVQGTAKITGNTNTNTAADYQAGGVSSAGVFSMTGGFISGNRATGTNGRFKAGGAALRGGSSEVSGDAVISGNEANSGAVGAAGGVYVSGNFAVSGDARISDNTAASSGSGIVGGVYCDNAAGGGVFTLSGNAVIGGNAATGLNTVAGGVLMSKGAFALSRDAVIRGNAATISGSANTGAGGVYLVQGSGVFSKTGGLIYGVDPYREPRAEADDNRIANGNTYSGYAVYARAINKKVDGDVTGNLSTADTDSGWD